MLQSVLATAIALPRRHPRRMGVWILSFGSVVLSLALQALMPDWRILPGAFSGIPAATLLAIFLAALACEFMDSSLGMGYGTTLTPLLLLMGFEPLQVVPAVLLSELFTGLAAGLMHQRDGNVDFIRDPRARRTALQLSALGTLGALAAVWVAVSVSKFVLGLFISGIVLAMGLVILGTRRRQMRYRSGSIVAVGAVAAFNKGLSGGGYGPLVTAGQVVSGLPAKHAVAITSVAESLACAVGLAAYLALGQTIDWNLAAPLATGALMSVPLATLSVRRISEHALRAMVGSATLVLGLVALLKLLH